MVNNRPTVYNASSIYKSVGGGGGGGGFIIPDGFKLFETIYNSSTFNSSNAFNFPVGKYNDEFSIYLNATPNIINHGEKINILSSNVAGEHFQFMIENYYNTIYVTTANGRAGASTFDVNYIQNSSKFCLGIDKDHFIDFYTKAVKRTISYERKLLTSFILFGAASYPSNYIQVHKVFLLDTDGDYINLYIPAKDENNNIGFLDIMTGNFIQANGNCWSVSNQLFP